MAERAECGAVRALADAWPRSDLALADGEGDADVDVEASGCPLADPDADAPTSTRPVSSTLRRLGGAALLDPRGASAAPRAPPSA